MEEKNILKYNQEIIDRVIKIAYGDANIWERIFVAWVVFKNKDLKNILKEYKATAESVHNIKRETVPRNVMKSVSIKINSINEPDNFLSRIYFTIISKPAISAGLAVILIIGLASLLLLKQPGNTHHYSKAQIEVAQKQLGESIAIINKIFDKAEMKLDKDIINDRLNKQLNKGLNLVNDYLIGG